MMGDSKYKTRTALLRERRLARPPGGRQRDAGSIRCRAPRRGGVPAPCGDAHRRRVVSGDGHGRYRRHDALASFDGMTMAGDILFEHKLWSADLASMIERRGELGPNWTRQLEHQLLVSGADRALFVTSDGTTRSVQAHVVHVHTRAACGADHRLAAIPRGSRRLRPRGTGARRGRLPDHGSAGRQREYRGRAASPVKPALEFGGRLRAFIDGLNPAPESDQERRRRERGEGTQAGGGRASGCRGPCPRANLGRRWMRKMKAMLHKLA